ncbi:SDR family oxidoreductase [Paenibacillus marinisediminis]
MKLLIIGGNGMAGHMLVRYFQQQGTHRVFYTTRNKEDDSSLLLELTDMAHVDHVLTAVRPHVVINAAGILNDACDRRLMEAYQVNGILPQRLRQRANLLGAKVVHISTDCVFSGARGSYSEIDEPDGTTAYAMTKALGELHPVHDGSPHLTIRTSIIGPEIRAGGLGLLAWFLRQTGEIRGYRNVRWNGVTTLALAKAIDRWIEGPLSGLVHLAHPSPVSKCELLHLFQEVYGKNDVDIVPQDEPYSDRTLVQTRADVHYELPAYEEMLRELVERTVVL